MPIQSKQQPPYYTPETGGIITGQIKTYKALLSQTGTNPPIATILQNTTGQTLTWSRSSAGFYKATAANTIFPLEKTTIFAECATIGTIINAGNDENGEPSDRIYVSTRTHAGVAADDLLYISPITITIYP